jgi:hypothetical protein
MDEIGSIISRSLALSRRDPTEFERLVNQQLKPYGIEFTRTSSVLVNSGAPAAYEGDMVLVRTPDLHHGLNVSNLMVAISHELVHRGQVEAADKKGGREAILRQSQRMVGPGGRVNWRAYQQDPHETAAYARSAVDVLRNQGLNREQVLKALQHGRSPVNRPGDRKRFLKRAYAYATQERARGIVSNLLENEETIDPKKVLMQMPKPKVERWIFAPQELEHPETTNAHDEFFASPTVEDWDEEGPWTPEYDVIVYRNGGVSNRWSGGSAGVPLKVQHATHEVTEYYSPQIGDFVNIWKAVYTDDKGNFLGWVKNPNTVLNGYD